MLTMKILAHLFAEIDATGQFVDSLEMSSTKLVFRTEIDIHHKNCLADR